MFQNTVSWLKLSMLRNLTLLRRLLSIEIKVLCIKCILRYFWWQDKIRFRHIGYDQNSGFHGKDMHNIMNELEFRPDRTSDYGVSCHWASKKYSYRPYNWENGVSTFSLLFLIGSFWYFHVTRTSIKAWMSLNFLKWDLTLAHWTQVSDRCPLGYLFRCSWAANSIVSGPIWPKFELMQDIKHVYASSNFKKDWINTNREKVETLMF